MAEVAASIPETDTREWRSQAERPGEVSMPRCQVNLQHLLPSFVVTATTLVNTREVFNGGP